VATESGQPAARRSRWRWPRPLKRVAGIGATTLLWLYAQVTASVAWAAGQAPSPTPAASGGLTVTPSWENAPWEPKVQTILNVTAQVSLACCVLAFLVGGAAMGVGRVVGSYQSGTRGLQFVLGGAGGALVIASAASIVSWLIS
jgi:hypothetical protein